MLKMTDTVKNMLKELTGQEGDYDGAFNIRTDGQSAGRQSTAAIRIEPKPNGAGLDIHIAPGTHRDKVHIPVVMTESGLKEVVYNDFHIGEGADVTIVASGSRRTPPSNMSKSMSVRATARGSAS